MNGSNVSEWVRFAQMDYDTAKNISALHHPVPLEIVCYHCQQCVEKILKAYLIAQVEPFQKSHDLNLLLNKCTQYEVAFDDYAAECITLISYAVLARYPVSEDAITENDMQTALKNTLDILDFTKARLAELENAQADVSRGV